MFDKTTASHFLPIKSSFEAGGEKKMIMKQKEFKEWLSECCSQKQSVIGSRISNCKNVENTYGDLDEHFNHDKCQRIINDLTYSSKDEREGRKPKHHIHIDGNIREGSASLKSAVVLYVRFRNFLSEISQNIPNESITVNSESDKLKKTVFDALESFPFKHETYNTTEKYSDLLNADLEEYLHNKLPDFTWKREFKPSDKCNDSVDILGESKESDYVIIIETDAHRADQVAKKFLSRLVLFLDHNVIYVSLCYPGTNRMSKTECIKYFNYCNTLSEFITQNSSKKKLYIGYMFEK